MSELSPLVSVCCLSYNHEKYIRQCLDGIVMQRINFPIEVWVHDDASTDGSADIIREYAAKYPYIKPIFQTENQYNKVKDILVKYIYPNCEGKYLAMCECDDYWTDPLKLQKLVDFLEEHKEYVLCCHRYKIYNENEDTWEEDYVSNCFKKHLEGFSFGNKENMEYWTTKTLTVLFRRELLCSLPDTEQFKFWRDVHQSYYFLKQGKGYCLPFIGAVYRRQNGGVCAPLSALDKQTVSVNIYRELYLANKDDVILSEYYQRLIKQYENTLRLLIRYRASKEKLKQELMLLYGIYWEDKAYAQLLKCWWHVQKSLFAKG